MTKKRLLVLTTTFPGEPGDGTPSFVHDVSVGLVADFDICVVAPKIPGTAPERYSGGLKVVRFGRGWPFSNRLSDGSILDNLNANLGYWLQLPFFILSFYLSARRQVREFKPDLLHAHWILPAGLVGRLVFGGPRVVTSHGGDLYALSGKFFTRLKKLSVQGAGVTVVNSEMASRVAALGIEDARVIPSGPVIATSKVKQRVPRQVLFVGRLVEKKGLEYLLDAVGALDCQLHVVGHGPLEQELRAKAPGNVVFHGRQTKGAVMDMIAASEVMVIPSVIAESGDREGMPLTLMEAAVSGAAVVATDLYGIAELVVDGTSGRLVPQRDSLALRNAIAELLDKPDLAESFRRNLSEQGERFSVSTVVGEYRSVLGRALISAE